MSELLKSMTARVVGVSFDNDDGTSRQDIISGLSVGEALLLNYHEYENIKIKGNKINIEKANKKNK